MNYAYAASLRIVQKRQRLMLSLYASRWWAYLTSKFSGCVSRCWGARDDFSKPSIVMYPPAVRMKERLGARGPFEMEREWAKLGPPPEVWTAQRESTVASLIQLDLSHAPPPLPSNRHTPPPPPEDARGLPESPRGSDENPTTEKASFKPIPNEKKRSESTITLTPSGSPRSCHSTPAPPEIPPLSLGRRVEEIASADSAGSPLHSSMSRLSTEKLRGELTVLLNKAASNLLPRTALTPRTDLTARTSSVPQIESSEADDADDMSKAWSDVFKSEMCGLDSIRIHS